MKKTVPMLLCLLLLCSCTKANSDLSTVTPAPTLEAGTVFVTAEQAATEPPHTLPPTLTDTPLPTETAAPDASQTASATGATASGATTSATAKTTAKATSSAAPTAVPTASAADKDDPTDGRYTGDNADVIGWICIDGTNIDYPILYGDDYFYHTHDENKKTSESGSIYTYYGSLTRNIVVAGHNARVSKTRFYQLHTLQNSITSAAKNGKAAKTYEIECSLYGYKHWRIFAMYETAANEPAATLRYNTHANCNNTTEWIETQLARSEVDFDTVPDKNDRFLTLETCGDKYDSSTAQSRLYYFLYAID